MHPNNPFSGNYNLTKLVECLPDLNKYLKDSPKGGKTLDFSKSEAVLTLNKALLKDRYQLDWDVPKGQLCPPVPGRLDYLYYIKDLVGKDVMTILDIGCGANIIYPLLSVKEFNWEVVASDINKASLEHASNVLDRNNIRKIDLRFQKNPSSLLKGVLTSKDKIDVCVSNPPFFKSKADVVKTNSRKNRNLNLSSGNMNFQGQDNELWCEGGEVGFILRLIEESKSFSSQVNWFTSLVSRKESLRPILRELKRISPKELEVVEMSTNNKVSRFIAWRF